MTGLPAVFVDRDGVVNALVRDPLTGRAESPLQARDVRLLDGVAQAIAKLRNAGLVVVGVSNQPAAAKQVVPLTELEAVQARVIGLLAAEGATFDDFRICWHHPDGGDPDLGRRCSCRKPAPGLLLAAAHDLGLDLASSWMIGDADTDVLAAAAAGARAALVLHPPSAHRRAGQAQPTLTAEDVSTAVDRLLAAGDR